MFQTFFQISVYRKQITDGFELINCNLDKKTYDLLYRNFASLNGWLLSFLCGGYFIKEILMEVQPPLSDGGFYFIH